MQLKIKKLTQTASIPEYAHPTDSGMDLKADFPYFVSIPPGERQIISTGISIELPAFTEAQIRSRSGLAAKNGIFVLNSPGTIDEGYTGEIKVILYNSSDTAFMVEPGMKIAQMVIVPVVRPPIVLVDCLAESERGSNGFGSTGV